MLKLRLSQVDVFFQMCVMGKIEPGLTLLCGCKRKTDIQISNKRKEKGNRQEERRQQERKT